MVFALFDRQNYTRDTTSPRAKFSVENSGRKIGGLTNVQQQNPPLFAWGDVLTTSLATPVSLWRRHPATWKGNLIYRATMMASRTTQLDGASILGHMQKLGSEPGRPQPAKNLAIRRDSVRLWAETHTTVHHVCAVCSESRLRRFCEWISLEPAPVSRFVRVRTPRTRHATASALCSPRRSLRAALAPPHPR